MQTLVHYRTRAHDWYQGWLDRRIPVTDSIKLSHRQLFIFPTKAGFGFLFLIMLLWLLGTNYENNLIFSLCFLLASLFVVAIHLTHANMSGIEVRPVKADSVFSGQHTTVTLALNQQGKNIRDSLLFSFKSTEPVISSLQGKGDQFVTLVVEAGQRGLLNPGRLTIESVYPFGLLRTWTLIKLQFNAVVYPKPIAYFPRASQNRGKGEGPFTGDAGSEDYAGLKRYQAGDSLRHIAWKHYAREQGLWSKHYADPLDHQLIIDWDAFPGMSREQRLGCMCHMVVESHKTGASYGLKLPGLEVKPGRGSDHYYRLLRHLALFEVESLT